MGKKLLEWIGSFDYPRNHFGVESFRIECHLVKMRTGQVENAKISKIMGFTIIESIFVILAVVVMAFILAGLYFKHNQLPAPDSPGRSGDFEKPGQAS